MQDLDALGVLLTDVDVLAAQTIIAVEPDPAQLPLSADLDAAAALCHDAAWLLAGAWVGRQLTANMPPRAWPEEFAELCLAVAARSQLLHEIDDDLDHLGERVRP